VEAYGGTFERGRVVPLTDRARVPLLLAWVDGAPAPPAPQP
jgi:hypothetical protein